MSRLFEALQRFESERTGLSFQWPHVDTPQPTPQSSVEESPLNQCAQLDVSGSPESRFVGLTAKDGLGAEKFRFLAVRLRQLSQAHSIKKILITSTIPEEGKSFISANLAIAFAHRHVQKILLIEGDLRRPVLLKQFGLPDSAGLCDLLQGSGAVTSHLLHLKNCGFWLLPAGNAPENPLELMQSERLGIILGQLAGIFDWIVIDSPPLLPLADTSIWARFADGILLVVREGKSQIGQLRAGLDAIKPRNLLGVVLNSSSVVDRSNYYQRYSTAATTRR